MIFLNPYVLTFFVVEAIVYAFSIVAFYYSLKISTSFNSKATQTLRYKLVEQGYLVSTILVFMLSVKLPLFLFFIWTMDEISTLIPGAMCAAGIVDGTNFGIYMFFFKIINLFLLSAWLFINSQDAKSRTGVFFDLKFKFFIVIFVFLSFELIFEFLHFNGLEVTKPVVCCSEIFKQTPLSKAMFWHKNWFILAFFYTAFLSSVFWAWLKIEVMFAASSFVFMLSAIYAIIRFFSPYIYELPLHKCPFCMLAKEYNYIGYLIYILLFVGVIYSLFVFIRHVLNLSINKRLYLISIGANLSLVLILSYYPIAFYLKNGVWL